MRVTNVRRCVVKCITASGLDKQISSQAEPLFQLYMHYAETFCSIPIALSTVPGSVLGTC